MNRFVLSCCAIAITSGLAGCSNFKATDKLMRNDHRVIQNTRIHQQKALPAIAPVQLPSTVTATVTQLPQQIDARTIIQQPAVTNTTVVRQVAAPVSTTTIVRPAVATVQQINVRTLNRVRMIELQRALAARGLYRAPIDGVFGLQTARGLATYQQQLGVRGPVTTEILRGLGISL